MGKFARFQRGLQSAYDNRKKIKTFGQLAGNYYNTARREYHSARHTPYTLTGTPMHRRQSVSSSMATSSRRGSTISSGLTSLSAPSTRIPLKIKRAGDRKTKGRKVVHVTKQFKEKVRACEATSKLSGYFQSNFKARILIQPVTNKTYIDDLAMCLGPGNGSLFSYANVLHAASRLWNSKAANASPAFNDTGNFENRTTIIDVRKQWATMRFKNNSLRTIRVKHFLCSPKSQQALFTPNQAWYQGITDMISSTRLIGTPTVTQNNLFIHPKTTDQFNQYFTSSETDYTLEPGQSIEENVEGPKMVYDGAKFWQTANYCTHQKQDIYSFVVYWYDLVVGTAPTALVGYINEPASIAATNGLLVQSTYHCHLSMPEPAGWISTGAAPAAGAVPLNNRLKRFCYDEFNSDNSAETAFTREDEQNPF